MDQIIQRFNFDGRHGTLDLAAVLSEVFSPHSIEVQQSRRNTASFSHAKLGHGSLSLLNIPTRSEVSCPATNACFVVFIRRGDVVYEIGNERFQAHAGQGIIINRGRSFSRKSGSAGADLTILKLSLAQLYRHLPIEAAEDPHGDIHFPSRFDVSAPIGKTLWRCTQYVQNELTRLDAGLDFLENHIANLENLLIRTMLDTVGRESSLACEVAVRNVLPAYMKKIISHMHAHCHEPIQLKDLRQISNVSERTINMGFNKYLDASPKQYLKQLRLQRVHEDLRHASAHTTVTNVAMRWGFCQLGWFSAEYRKQFGQTPSETLKAVQFSQA